VGRKQGVVRLQFFRMSSCGRDIPPEATTQRITIGGRPGFVDGEPELCSAAVSVLWHGDNG